MKKVTTTILLTALFFLSKGQTEFLVTINPATGIHSIIDSLPGVNFILSDATAYDKNNKHFIFYGSDFFGSKRLFCVDAISGHIISQPLFSLNVSEFQYDHSSNTLYALYSNSTTGQLSLVSLDISTGANVQVAVLPVNGFIGGSTTFDEVNHDFIFKHSGSFYTINTVTGNITVTPATADYEQLQFDNNTGKLYGILTGTSIWIAEINSTTGTYVIVGTVATTGYVSTSISYDELNHIYTFESSGHLYSVDVTTGTNVSSPLFPGVVPPENVIELHYDHSSGILYALHWGALKTAGTTDIEHSEDVDFSISPNPFTSQTTLTFSNEQTNTLIRISDILGNEIKSINFSGRQLVMDKAELRAGTYFIQAIDSKKFIRSRMIIIQ